MWPILVTPRLEIHSQPPKLGLIIQNFQLLMGNMFKLTGQDLTNQTESMSRKLTFKMIILTLLKSISKHIIFLQAIRIHHKLLLWVSPNYPNCNQDDLGLYNITECIEDENFSLAFKWDNLLCLNVKYHLNRIAEPKPRPKYIFGDIY